MAYDPEFPLKVLMEQVGALYSTIARHHSLLVLVAAPPSFDEGN